MYLAVSGRSHSRDALATLFYPDHSQSKARAYLRRDLAVVNTTLGGEWLDADRETIELKKINKRLSDIRTHHRGRKELALEGRFLRRSPVLKLQEHRIKLRRIDS